jgi:hypothetical protein
LKWFALMKIEQFRYGPKDNSSMQFEETKGASALLPEDKIIELYNLHKPTENIQLHQPYCGPPVISISYVEATMDDKGRETTQNRTFLISLRDITNELLVLLRDYVHTEKVEPLNLEFSIIAPNSKPQS